MKFCENCSSLMTVTDDGYVCVRCGNRLKIDTIEYNITRESRAEPVYTVKGDIDAMKVNQTCPLCGHHEAYRSVSVSIGEHAGVKVDRSVEHYRCVKCGNTWLVS